MGKLRGLAFREGGSCLGSWRAQALWVLGDHVPIFPKEARVEALMGCLIFKLRHMQSHLNRVWVAVGGLCVVEQALSGPWVRAGRGEWVGLCGEKLLPLCGLSSPTVAWLMLKQLGLCFRFLFGGALSGCLSSGPGRETGWKVCGMDD